MPKRLTLAPHCRMEELHRHYRQAKDPIVRSRFHILWLLAQGEPSEAVAKATGYTRPWIAGSCAATTPRDPWGSKTAVITIRGAA